MNSCPQKPKYNYKVESGGVHDSIGMNSSPKKELFLEFDKSHCDQIQKNVHPEK